MPRLAPPSRSSPMPVECRRSISSQSGGFEQARRRPVSFSTQRNAGMFSFDPSRIPAWLAPVCDERSVSHSASAWEPLGEPARHLRSATRVDRATEHREREAVDLEEHDSRLRGVDRATRTPRDPLHDAKRVRVVVGDRKQHVEDDADRRRDERRQERPEEPVDDEGMRRDGRRGHQEQRVEDEHEQESEHERVRQPKRRHDGNEDRVEDADDERDGERRAVDIDADAGQQPRGDQERRRGDEPGQHEAERAHAERLGADPLRGGSLPALRRARCTHRSRPPCLAVGADRPRTLLARGTSHRRATLTRAEAASASPGPDDVASRRTGKPPVVDIELAAYGQRVVVDQVGGGLRSYSARGHEVLDGYPSGEPSPSGRGQVLIPWPNRLEDGRYDFDGRSHELPLNEPEHRNAIHGLVRWATWDVGDRQADRVVMEHVLEPQPGYPFTLQLAIEYALSGAGLRVRTTATNAGSETCPYGSGAHPYLTVGTVTVDPVVMQVPGRTVLESRRARASGRVGVRSRERRSTSSGREPSAPPGSTTRSRISIATRTTSRACSSSHRTVERSRCGSIGHTDT